MKKKSDPAKIRLVLLMQSCKTLEKVIDDKELTLNGKDNEFAFYIHAADALTCHYLKLYQLPVIWQ